MNFYTSLDVIFYLKKHKYFILLGGLTVAVIVFFSHFFSPKSYEANVIVYNTNKFGNNAVTEKSGQSIQGLDETYTIINWVYSSELLNFLITQFDLYKHYGIDTTGENHYTLVFNQLSDNLLVSTTSYNAVKITVRDQDRIMAASIANEIVKKVDALNESLVVAKRKQIIQVYDFLLDELSDECNKQKDSINIMVQKLSSVIASMKQHNISYGKMEGMETSLLKAGFNYERAASDWLNTKKSHLVSLKYIEKFNLPSFVIVRHAMPAIPESPYTLANFGLLFIAFLLGGWVVILFLVIKYKYAAYFYYLFGASPGEVAKEGRVFHIGEAASRIKKEEDPPPILIKEKREFGS